MTSFYPNVRNGPPGAPRVGEPTPLEAAQELNASDPLVIAWNDYRAGDGPMPSRYPDHAPMRGDDIDRDSHDGCDICRWQREGLAFPFIPQKTPTYLESIATDEASGVAP